MERITRVLVTGGTGFLGRKLAERLQAGGYDVTALGRNERIGQELAASGMLFKRVDLGDADAIRDACKNQDIVFHAGALSSPWGKPEEFHRSNVLGTRHVIAGCQAHEVRRLIHVSSPSVLFEFRDCLDLPESTPYPTVPANAYAATKQQAEKDIDQAFAGGLPVIMFRPRALFGPGDTVIFPRLIRASRRAFPMFGNPLIDLTYVENAVDALMLGMTAPSAVLGRKYHVTNGTPIPLRDLLTTVFGRLGQPYRTRSLPPALGLALAGLSEGVTRLTGSDREPVLTRYSVGTLAYSQTLDISAIRRDLGYQPRIGIEEGIDRFARWWKETHG